MAREELEALARLEAGRLVVDYVRGHKATAACVAKAAPGGEAARELRHYEYLVEAIASALLERHELTAREVAALLREAAKRTRYSAPSREG